MAGASEPVASRTTYLQLARDFRANILAKLKAKRPRGFGRAGEGVGSAVVCLGRRVEESGSLPRAVEAVLRSSSLPMLWVLSLPLPVASIRRPLPLHIGFLPATVVVGHVLGVRLLPASDARLAPWGTPILP
jgi:hypothetical protein